MNNIRQIQALNKRELENAMYVSSTSVCNQVSHYTNLLTNRPPAASWHADYRDTAYIYIGGLPFDLSEGDIVTICSQFGEPVHINLVRDKETGKSRGFAFLKYEDQRSTDLAVDNLGGSTILGRILRVDHVRYKRRDDEEDEGDNVAKIMGDATAPDAAADSEEGRRHRRNGGGDGEGENEPPRPQLKEEKELVELIQNHDEEDPMKEFLVTEKKEEIAQALERIGSSEKKSSRRRKDSRERSSRHHHRHHRHRRDEGSRERRRRDNRSPSGEKRSHRDRSPSRRERSHRDRSPRSRSPDSRRHRERDDRRH